MRLMKPARDLLVLAAAAAGGALGYFVFFWAVRQGFYGLIIPGGLLGLSASFVKGGSLLSAVLCGLGALALGLFCEWRFGPFVKDDSLGYFLLHLHQLRPITLIMLGVGTFIGFWLPFRSRRLPSAP